MRKIALLVSFLLVIAVPVFAADVDNSAGPIGVGIGAVGANAQAGAVVKNSGNATIGDVGVGNRVGDIKNIGNPENTFNPTFSPTFSPRNTNIQGQGQDQDQKQQQGQIQGQGQDQGQMQGQMNNWSQTYISERPFQNIPDLTPYSVPLIQGRVGNVTGTMPNYAGVQAYKGEAVVAVKVFKGTIFDRIRLEDVEAEVLDCFKIVTGKKTRWWEEGKGLAWPAEKVRYAVHYKDSSMGAGIGGGGQYGGSSMSGDKGASGLGSVLPGYSRSTADPQYLIKFYLVQ